MAYAEAVERSADDASLLDGRAGDGAQPRSNEQLVSEVLDSSGAEAAFRQGFLDHGGNPAWLEHFVAMGSGQWMNAECPRGESSGLLVPWRYGDSYHLSALQFAPTSWSAAAAATGLSNAEDLYHVGANTAWWSNNVDPAGTGGWACWPW